ncbi:hypothetical protein G4Y73_13490 [Wenzhouxiangella sp. XN201]|uniref:right-handed parallel beta-helix repeat-containing protein n=1 Tax=Wenzhouxiangella sp. XN201 TaxID=2710755 RepID=UPI0013C9CCDC|nr:right-handed parallel beta-helix repeat-containing protein [Wenzhouxiangella sp. XN201]NEZ05164.1 hypothetical protein [Wenzhouxiangella sp. XN201]
MQYAKRFPFFIASALALLGGVPPLVTSAAAQPIHSNLIANGDFEAFSDWTLLDAPLWGSSSFDPDYFCNSPNPTGCLQASVTPIASSGERRVSSAWQCVDVEPNRAYEMSLDIHGNLGNPGSSSARMLLLDVTGNPCPEADSPPQIGDSFASAFLFEPFGWGSASGVGIVPAGVTRVATALHSTTGSSSESAKFFFDNAVLGKLRPDVSVQMSVSATELDPLQQFTIEVSYDSQYNGTPLDLRIIHGDRISLVGYVCDAGAVVDASQGGEHFFRWFNIPEDPQPHTRSCTITARADSGFAGVVGLNAVADCADCDGDLNPGDNDVSIPVEILEAPDMSVSVAASELPEAGDEFNVFLEVENLGTSSEPLLTMVSVEISEPMLFHSVTGEHCSLTETMPGLVEGAVWVSHASPSECQLAFGIPEDQVAMGVDVAVYSVTDRDYISSNDTAVASSRIVNLTVNRSIDGWDGSPGDGICESSSGNDDCSLRAAVMEANALAAATGRTFTVKVPYSPFSYTLARTSGEDESLHGSLKIKRRMHLVGIPDEDGNLPFVVGSFPTVETDRLIRIGNPASFVRIENMHLQGQGLVPTDTDGNGTDGGLILHQSGELVLSNVTLTDGMTDGSGGALHSASDDGNGHLTLEQVRIFDNEASDGGGLTFMPESFATLSVIDSNVHDNQANAAGGGILAWNSGGGSLPAVAIQRSALHGNAALLGGGAYLYGVFLAQVSNSTVSGNIAETSGGGISVEAATSLAVNNSTIAFNEAGPGDNNSGNGGGLYVNANATATLYNSIVSSNTGKEACSRPNPSLPPICVPQAANCYGSVDSAGYNAMAGDSECAFNSGGSDDATHVQLGALADNGGSTPTHAPASFNWIVDAGDPACLDRPGGEPLLIDQRGAVRPADGDEDATAQCDRGAYELSENARVSVLVDDAALGRVQSSPTGIWCGEGTNDSCSALFSLDAEVVLTATLASGSGGEFIGWEGACAGQGAVCTVTAAGNVETTALFVLAAQPDFLLGCEGGSTVEVQEGGTAQVSCSVESVNGYSQAVSLLCFESATSIDCQPSAVSVTPPADGSQSFTLSVNAGQTPPGDYSLLVEGSDGERVRQAGLGLSVVEPVSGALFSDRFEQ